MASIEYYAYTVKLLWKSLEQVSNGLATSTDIERWLDMTHNAIQALEQLITLKTLTRAEK